MKSIGIKNVSRKINLEISKTVFDYTIVLLSAVVVVPVCLLTALAIRLESPGKAIYSQVRVGQGVVPLSEFKNCAVGR